MRCSCGPRSLDWQAVCSSHPSLSNGQPRARKEDPHFCYFQVCMKTMSLYVNTVSSDVSFFNFKLYLENDLTGSQLCSQIESQQNIPNLKLTKSVLSKMINSMLDIVGSPSYNPTIGRQRQEDHEIEASLSYTVSSRPTWNTQ